MTTQNIIDSQTQEIIKKYTVLYKAIFQYSVYFIPLILGIVRAWTLQSSEVIARTQIATDVKQPTFTQVDWIYRGNRISDEVWSIYNGFGDVKILWWELQATGDVVIGRNNLITLGWANWGIVLPNRPYIINIWFTWGTKYFTQKDYDIDKLKWVIDNWILSLAPTDSKFATGIKADIDKSFFRSKDKRTDTPTNMEEVLKVLQDKMYFDSADAGLPTSSVSTIKEKDKLINEFWLSCLKWRKVTDTFCNINVDRFIKQIPDLTLDDAWYDMLYIAEKIRGSKQIDVFCSNLMVNVLKKPYPTIELDKIMGWACVTYEGRYEKLKKFLWIQNQIESIVSEDIVLGDVDFNLFKLVSVQQKLYGQHKDKLLDTNTIITYLRFLNNLINNREFPIPQFYIDASYYYNNVYLKSMLRKLSLESVNPTVNDDVSKILDLISSINKWNPSIWVIWLDSLVLHTSLKKDIQFSTWEMFNSIQNFEQVFTDEVKLQPEVRITRVETDDTTRTARLVGSLRYKANSEEWIDNTTINIIADFEYISGRFTISSVRTPDNAAIDHILQTYIQKNQDQKPSFSTIIYLIKSNLDAADTTLTLCDIVIWKIEYGEFISCNETRLVIRFRDRSTLTLVIKNDVVISGTSTNSKKIDQIKNLLKEKKFTQDRIVSTINGMWEAIEIEVKKAEDTKDIGQLDTTKLAIIAKFKKFFNTEPSEIVNQNGKWLITFMIKDYEFASVIDIQNNYKLSPLVIRINQKNIVIDKFSLTLIPFSQTRINQFVDDPLHYIKQINEVKYNQIMKELKPAN